MPTPMQAAENRTGNLFDYVIWRGDIPMSVDPFNEVDNLLMATLAYVPFDGIVPAEGISGSITIKEVYEAYSKSHDLEKEKDLALTNPAIGYSPFLLQKAASSRRFSGIRCCSYANEMDDDDQYQFAAVTFLLEDGTCYAAFRGTDDSIAGWREDMNLSYMAMTRGQERAVEYLNRRFTGTSPFIRLGGHSKGGNLAVYAGMYSLPDIQGRIKEIWTNDGPGFIKTITGSEDYKRILPKIRKFIPEESIVGILLDSGTEAAVIKSTEDGVMQHNPFSWKIRRNRIERSEKRSDSSVFMGETLNNWITSLDPDNRKVFIEVLFDAISSSGARTISEFMDDPVRAYNAFYRSIRDLPRDRRATILLVFQKLAESGTNQVIQGLSEKLSELARKMYE